MPRESKHATILRMLVAVPPWRTTTDGLGRDSAGSWEECRYCNMLPTYDPETKKHNLGHTEGCAYRKACELLHVEMASAY